MSQPTEWTIELSEPVTDWLDALDRKDRERVLRTIGLLRTYGVQLPMPYARHLRGKLFELRVSAARRDYRVIYFAHLGRRMVLLHAFAKTTQKTPERQLAIAERRMTVYLAEQEESE